MGLCDKFHPLHLHTQGQLHKGHIESKTMTLEYSMCLQLGGLNGTDFTLFAYVGGHHWQRVSAYQCLSQVDEFIVPLFSKRGSQFIYALKL